MRIAKWYNTIQKIWDKSICYIILENTKYLVTHSLYGHTCENFGEKKMTLVKDADILFPQWSTMT